MVEKDNSLKTGYLVSVLHERRKGRFILSQFATSKLMFCLILEQETFIIRLYNSRLISVNRSPILDFVFFCGYLSLESIVIWVPYFFLGCVVDKPVIILWQFNTLFPVTQIISISLNCGLPKLISSNIIDLFQQTEILPAITCYL